MGVKMRAAIGRRSTIVTALAAVFAAIVLIAPEPLLGQGGRGQAPGGRGGQGGPPGGRGQAAAANLPATPTAVALPTLSAEVTGPGAMFESAPSLAPGRDTAHYKYRTQEYWVSGTANGEPYKTRLVVRTPGDTAAFSGLVLVEAMHPSGAAHMFEYTSMYTMSSGHAAVEVVVAPQAITQFTQLNEARYRDFQLTGPQASEILAQVGSLLRSAQAGPLAGLTVRTMVLGGTSATAGTLVNYLPAHMVYRTPDMQRIFDGFLPTSRGDVEPRVDVPMILIPTMNEVNTPGNSRRQDGDEGDNQFRLYEFAGMVHVDTRDNVRFEPNPCRDPLSDFPLQAYMSVGLHHLFEWADKGTVPPRADRIWITRVADSMMALDEHGNPLGGIRNPYVDVPVATYVPGGTMADPAISNPSPLFAPILCGLGGSQAVFPQQKLRQLYRNERSYVRAVEQRLNELEKAGWSLPVYRDTILEDARQVDF